MEQKILEKLIKKYEKENESIMNRRPDLTMSGDFTPDGIKLFCNNQFIEDLQTLAEKIDELLPSEELQKYFYDRLKEVFEMGLSRDAFDADNSESVLPYLDLDVAKEMVNHIKNKLK